MASTCVGAQIPYMVMYALDPFPKDYPSSGLRLKLIDDFLRETSMPELYNQMRMILFPLFVTASVMTGLSFEEARSLIFDPTGGRR
jgi:hypothetical protein